MTTKTRKKKLYLGQQAGGWDADPSADGSTEYAHLQTEELSLIEDRTEVLDTQYDNGENVATAPDRAGDGAVINLKTPWRGYATAGGDAAAPDTADAMDKILQSVLGAATSRNGVAADVGTGVAALATTSDTPQAQDLVPVWESGVNGGRVQWRRVNESTSPYTLDRNFDDAPSSSAVCFATRSYRGPLNADGELLAGYYVLDNAQYSLLNGRPQTLKIAGEVRKRVMLETSILFDTKTKTSKGSIPVVDSPVTPPAIKLVKASTVWNGTRYGVKSFEIDFMPVVQQIDADNGTNGRSDIECMEIMPMITLTPQYADSPWVDDFRAGTSGLLFLEYGGVNSSGQMNSTAFVCTAQVVEAPLSDDEKIVRNTVKLKAIFNGIFSGSTHELFWQLYRA